MEAEGGDGGEGHVPHGDRQSGFGDGRGGVAEDGGAGEQGADEAEGEGGCSG